jgi:hypothetical protein
MVWAVAGFHGMMLANKTSGLWRTWKVEGEEVGSCCLQIARGKAAVAYQQVEKGET